MSESAREAGISALQRGDSRTAIQCFLQVVQANPQDAQGYGYLGAAYGQLNMNQQAAEAFGRAAQIAPLSAPVRFNLGVTMEKCGRREEAVAAYRQVLVLDASYEKARQALGRLGEPVNASGAAASPGPAGYPPSGGFNSAATVQASPSAYAPSPPVSGPPGGMQALGDWSPPPPPAAPMGSIYDTPLAPPPTRMTEASGTLVAAVDAPEMGMSRSAQLGHCYLAGMGMGVWWGLIGAIFSFLSFMVHTMASDLGKVMPVIITICVMNIAFGALLYGVIGLAGGATEDAESACGNFGLAVGILGALISGFVSADMFMFLGLPSVVGSIWISRQMGRALGNRINEMQTTVFLVAGPGGVQMTTYRKH